MHILYLTSGLSFGGAQKITVGLAEQAVQRGHEASFLTICPGNDYEERLQAKNISLQSLKYEGRFTPRNLLSILQLREAMEEKIRQVNPDLVHEQLFIPKLLAFGKSMLGGCPVVHTQQDTSPWWPKGDLYSRLQTFIERRFSRRTADQNVAISEGVRDGMVQAGLVNSKEACPVIPNFTDLSVVDDDPPGEVSSEGIAKIFMVSRLTWEKKGLDTAVEVLARLLGEEENANLVIVGDGPDRDRMAAFAAEKGVRSNVEFRGYQQDVRRQYQEADVVLMPSRWEGFGITAIEAAACGTPVVGSKVGGLQDVIVHGETGFTCPPDDVSCFVSHIRTLLSDQSLYEQFVRKGAERVRQHFTPEAAFGKYEKIYRRVAPVT